MDNAKTNLQMFKNGFHNLGGQMTVDDYGLRAQLRLNKFHIFPFAAPELRDNPLVILDCLLQTTTGAVYFDPRFINDQIIGKNIEIGLFVISRKFLPKPEFYTFVENMSLATDDTINVKENILLTSEVCFIGEKIFSIMDTVTVELTNVVIATTITTLGVIDTKKRKMANIPSFVQSKTKFIKHNLPPEHLDVASIDYNISLDTVVSSTFPVTLEHIDFQKHVNMMVYMSLALKMILDEKVTHKSKQIKEFFITFIKESRLGDNLKAVAWRNNYTRESYCKISKMNDILSAFARATFYENGIKSKL